MDHREKWLYHQVVPVKLATDIGSALIGFWFLWVHAVLPAAIVTFVPPIFVSAALMRWSHDLERVKRSPFGRYVRAHMTPAIEALRLLALLPIALGAWSHDLRFAFLGVAILVVAWANGLIWRRRAGDFGEDQL